MYPMLMTLYTQFKVAQWTRASQKAKGQGVVEYAGALVVAALVVAAVIGLGPTAISEAFTSIMTSITKTLTSKL
jgi:Flp pilus assembly pilin Flp